ncbi:MAG: hypothetical protein JWO79_3707 [Actinomycetia bacterium]|nr:hypothetical protein [Actinomycetes bacterium]
MTGRYYTVTGAVAAVSPDQRLAVLRTGTYPHFAYALWDTHRRSTVRTLAVPPISDDPLWSPNGARLAFPRRSQPPEDVKVADIAFADVATGAIRTVSMARLGYSANSVIAWSPDSGALLAVPGPLDIARPGESVLFGTIGLDGTGSVIHTDWRPKGDRGTETVSVVGPPQLEVYEEGSPGRIGYLDIASGTLGPWNPIQLKLYESTACDFLTGSWCATPLGRSILLKDYRTGQRRAVAALPTAPKWLTYRPKIATSKVLSFELR